MLQGKVSLGALVAALAAYKDLASPWKELLAYYNQTQDMSLRWEVILERFAPQGMVDEKLMTGEPENLEHLSGDVVLDDVNVRDSDGNLVLEDLSATFPASQVIGIAAPSEEDRRALAELLTREILPSAGTVKVAGQNFSGLHQATVAARIGYATSRPVLFQGSFGDNVMMPMRLRPTGEARDRQSLEIAKKAGNSPDPFDAPWLDPQLAGFSSEAELRGWWLKLVEGIGSDTALFRRGVEQRFAAPAHPELADQLVKLRPAVRDAIRTAGLDAHVHFLEAGTYNPALPVAENLLFAASQEAMTGAVLHGQTEFLDQLKQLGLDEGLVALTRDVVEMLRQIFGMDGTGHPLFRKLGLDVDAYETALALVDRPGTINAAAISREELAQLLIVPFTISAEQIGPAFEDRMKEQILGFRRSHGPSLLKALGTGFDPFSLGNFAPSLTVLENALFGKISDAAGAKGDEVRKLVSELMVREGLRDQVVELIFDMPIAVGGSGSGGQLCRASGLLPRHDQAAGYPDPGFGHGKL